MKYIALLASVAILIGSQALAADLPSRKVEPVAPVAPTFTWTGFYAGINAGVNWANRNVSSNYIDVSQDPLPPDQLAEIFPSPAPHGNSRTGFIGGLQIGYNYQIDRFVIGAEADFMGAILSKSNTATLTVYNFLDESDTLTEAFTSKIQQNWLGTLRARAGFTYNRVLIYATGGLAYGNVQSSLGIRETWGNDIANWYGSKNWTKLGYTIGAGVEYALTNNWIIRGEYLYYNLGAVTTYALPTDQVTEGVPGPNTYTVQGSSKTTIDGNIVRAAISYKF